MSLTGQDWWRWDQDGQFWRAIRSGLTTEPDPVEPDPDDPMPDPAGRHVLLVTETGTLGAGNQELHDILVADDWTVTVRSLADAENYDGISVLVMSAGNPAQDTGAYMFPPVGVVAVDSWLRLGMGVGLGFAKSPLTVEVVDPTSPLAAGYSGTFDAYQSEAWMTWKPETDSELQTVVTRAGQPDERVVFAYEAGSQMPGRYAAVRHVGLGYHADGFAAGLSVQARAQFLAAVRWARDTPVEGLDVPSAPTSLSAVGADSRVILSWTAPAFAENYVVRRGTVTGGPYTDIASGVTSTSYTDTSAVNDTTYFYVVAARNSSGEGPNSTEASATPTAVSTENLAMLATSAEVAMWQDRAVNGPFRVAGDFSANSPGHWSEMVTAAGRAPFQSARWDGPTFFDGSAISRFVGTGNDPPGGVKNMAHDMYSAAIVAMTNNDTTLAGQIVAEIEWQATRTTLNYGSRTLWPFYYYNDINPLFMHAVWVKDYVLAYDLCKGLGQTSSTVEQWFLNLAELCEQIVHANMSNRFPDRRSDSYVTRSSGVNTSIQGHHRLADGTIIYYPNIMQFYSNRRNNQAGLFGLVGAVLNNQFYIDEFKRYMREWVMFGNRLGDYGGYGDINRGGSSFPQLGYSYALHGLESCLPAMEGLARQGDTDLYEFSSSDGSTHATWGTAHLKSMEDCLDSHLKWIARTWPAQYTGSGTPPPESVAGDEFYRVHSRNTGNNREIVNDANFLYAANYFNRSDWVDIIMRQGTPSGFTSAVQGVGNVSGWRVDWRNRFTRSLTANPHGGA